MIRPWFITVVSLLFAAMAQGSQVGLIHVEGAIGPATAGYITRAVDEAAAQNDQCLIIELDTPGGLLDSASEIVRTLYNSKVPTVVYVAPAPARAGSAGVFITMAADIAAMAPFTRIGAAHPVELGSSGEAEKVDDTMKAKIENDTAALAQSIAEKRHRNATWAIASVRQSASITAEEALKQNVINLIASDMPDLLNQLNGREVNGRKLDTLNAAVVPIPMGVWEQMSQLFLRPETMFILMLLVIYGFIGELSSPGAILPGVVGAIALILVLYMSAILPVNVAGLVLMGLALLLFIADTFAPTHGVLTAGGIVAFFLGALMLFNHAGPGYQLSLRWILPGTLLTAAFFIFVVSKGVAAQRRPATTGIEALIGRQVDAQSRIDSSGGRVFIEGETWQAVSDVPVDSGRPVTVTGVRGLILLVKPLNNS
jgi:membrane-bound serine protease (ClpP class)